ncbi:hypothetical protein BGX29_001774 [Mortierella sp. GBA35]|nr:hypothetical protein BGX29_001774 [Mortierella sp. GBA35]
MSIFDIPELASSLVSHLSFHDLTVCVSVSKDWNALFVPFLWRNIPPQTLQSSFNERHFLCWVHFKGWDSFRRLLREDYLSAHQRQQHHLHEDEENDKTSVSFLARYGPWIRTLAIDQRQLKETPKATPFGTWPAFGQTVALAAVPTAVPTSSLTGSSVTTLPVSTAFIATATTTSSTSTITRTAETVAPDHPPVPEPTEQELLLHLLKHCPNFESLELVDWDATDADLEFWRTIARDVAPNLVELGVSFNRRYDTGHTPSKKLVSQFLLARCSAKMRRLRIPYGNTYCGAAPPSQVDEGENDEGQVLGHAEREEPLANLKDMSISAIGASHDWSALLKFLKRCVCLESLTVDNIHPGWIWALRERDHLKKLVIGSTEPGAHQVLADILRAGYLPNLDDIEVQWTEEGDGLANMLSACRKGWRSVTLSTLDALSADALVQHCPTLESLMFRMTPGLTSAHMRKILSSSPNLHTFITLDDGEYVSPEVTYFLAEDFIDRDPATGAIKPWLCESSLKVFRAKVLGIPRPDVTLTHYGRPREELLDEDGAVIGVVDVLQEAYPGQSRELQRRVYERFSRFTHLEILGLGHDDRDFGAEYNYVENAEGECVLRDDHYQYECLDMSLGTGLSKLGGLRELRELNIMRMATSIGVEEVRWMAESWTKLEVLTGLDPEGRDAYKWWEENRPQIKSYSRFV